MNLKQERDSITPIPDPRPESNPKMEEQDHSPHQDMIPALDQDMIDLNLLEDDQNQQIVINCEHNREHNTFPPIRCIDCKCDNCYKNKKTLEEIKDFINKKLDVKIVNPDPPANVNLCESVAVPEDMVINYTYTDLGRQMMILDLGAPVSIAGVSWMKQYLEGFDLEIENMKSVSCNQTFVFGPSRIYLSKPLIELSILVTRIDGKDVLKVQTYLIDAEVPFLSGKQTLESWNFKIYGPEKILEIQMKIGEDKEKKFLKMEDTVGGHYGIVLETRKKKNSNLFLLEDVSGKLFMEDKEGDPCSFKAVRKVHEVNRHKGKEQLLSA